MEKTALTPEYKLPFGKYDKVIELGGGDKPLFHPNVDIRWLPSVDIIASLEWPLPVENEAFNGIFCRYGIEHISWRKSRGLFSEMYRILKPGGIAVAITANLLAQCKKLVETEEWNDDLICMLFGDQDYLANTHRCGFSPAYAIKLFKEAGFYQVKTFPLLDCPTDLIIEAWKSKARLL